MSATGSRPGAILAVAVVLLASVTTARAHTVTLAVAANFAGVVERIAAGFTEETGHEVVISAGPTGGLYAQIAQGAPFDVFLAADAERPARAEAESLAVNGTRFTYAIGRLALLGGPAGSDGAAVLAAGRFERLAIADPEAAPYGRAALETLAALGLTEALADRLVTGTSIAQAYQFVATGNAELGLVALSQVIATDPDDYWLVPAPLHQPIAQDAVLLTRAADNRAALDWMDYLGSDPARAIVESFGYDLP